MIFVKIFLLCCGVSVAFGGGSTFCEPFFTNYFDFLEKFLKSVEQRKQTILSDIQNFTFYTNASKVESQIIAENYFYFFINVTSDLANLSTETVEGVVNGSITNLPDPLNCVAGSFEIVNQVLHDMLNQTLNVAVSISHPSPSTNTTGNCTDINAVFPLYAAQLQHILAERTSLNQIDAVTFAQFTDSLIALNIAQNENQFMLMVTALADVLHIDVSFAQELISGHFFDTSSAISSSPSS